MIVIKFRFFHQLCFSSFNCNYKHPLPSHLWNTGIPAVIKQTIFLKDYILASILTSRLLHLRCFQCIFQEAMDPYVRIRKYMAFYRDLAKWWYLDNREYSWYCPLLYTLHLPEIELFALIIQRKCSLLPIYQRLVHN